MEAEVTLEGLVNTLGRSLSRLDQKTVLIVLLLLVTLAGSALITSGGADAKDNGDGGACERDSEADSSEDGTEAKDEGKEEEDDDCDKDKGPGMHPSACGDKAGERITSSWVWADRDGRCVPINWHDQWGDLGGCTTDFCPDDWDDRDDVEWDNPRCGDKFNKAGELIGRDPCSREEVGEDGISDGCAGTAITSILQCWIGGRFGDAQPCFDGFLSTVDACSSSREDQPRLPPVRGEVDPNRSSWLDTFTQPFSRLLEIVDTTLPRAGAATDQVSEDVNVVPDDTLPPIVDDSASVPVPEAKEGPDAELVDTDAPESLAIPPRQDAFQAPKQSADTPVPVAPQDPSNVEGRFDALQQPQAPSEDEAEGEPEDGAGAGAPPEEDETPKVVPTTPKWNGGGAFMQP